MRGKGIKREKEEVGEEVCGDEEEGRENITQGE